MLAIDEVIILIGFRGFDCEQLVAGELIAGKNNNHDK